MTNFLRRHIFYFVMLTAFCLTACEKTAINHTPAEIKVFKNGTLEISEDKGKNKNIYIDIRDSTGHLPLSPEKLEQLLTAGKFTIVDSPSKAGYILHISILQEGQTSLANLEQLVKAGYGGEARFSGGSESAWLADILLVVRRVPSASRKSNERLKNISARNALGSSQMRIGLITNKKLSGRREFMREFGGTLARELENALCGVSAVKTDP